MTVPRSFYAALAVCFVAGFLSMLGLQRADAVVGTCQQAWSRVYYSYNDPQAVPDGADYSGASDSDVTSGPDAGQVGCMDFQTPLAVRMSTLADPAVTTTVQFTFGELTAAEASSADCTALIMLPDGGIDARGVMDPTVAGDGTSYMNSVIPFNADLLSALTLDQQTTLPLTIDCGGLGVFHTAFLITAVSQPDPTQVTLSRTTSKVAASTVSGRLLSHRHGVAGQHVVVQHRTSTGWHRVAKVTTDHFGRYTMRLHDSLPLRAKYPATLRLWGSTSKVR